MNLDDEQEQQMAALRKSLARLCEFTAENPGTLRIIRMQARDVMGFFYVQDGEVKQYSSFSWN